jgi:hypothetical protein
LFPQLAFVVELESVIAAGWDMFAADVPVQPFASVTRIEYAPGARFVNWLLLVVVNPPLIE